MKTAKFFIRLTSALLALVMTALVLCSCGSTPVATFTAENGKTYTATKSELDFLMVYSKQNIFTGNGWFSAYDNNSLWSTDYKDGLTYDEYFTSSIFSQLKSILVEKYLFDKFDLKLNDETVAAIKKETETLKLNAGGAGAYKQYYGHTTNQYYDYRLTSEKYNAILDYLYGENGIEKVTEAEKETYFNENFLCYQIIVLDMNNKIEVDENGNRVRQTTKDENGNEIESDAYKFVELTDEEASEKELLAATILQKLENGESFESLMAQYSDSYTSVKYPKGIYTVSSNKLFNDTTANDEVDKLEVGQHTGALNIGDGEYTYIVRRVALEDKAYESEEYSEIFETYDDTVKYDKYDKFLNAYFDSVVIDAKAVEGYSMESTFLSKYVDYYFRYSQYYN